MGDVRKRLESIDEFRGSAILLMVLANCLEGPDISVGILLAGLALALSPPGQRPGVGDSCSEGAGQEPSRSLCSAWSHAWLLRRARGAGLGPASSGMARDYANSALVPVLSGTGWLMNGKGLTFGL